MDIAVHKSELSYLSQSDDCEQYGSVVMPSVSTEQHASRDDFLADWSFLTFIGCCITKNELDSLDVLLCRILVWVFSVLFHADWLREGEQPSLFRFISRSTLL